VAEPRGRFDVVLGAMLLLLGVAHVYGAYASWEVITRMPPTSLNLTGFRIQAALAGALGMAGIVTGIGLAARASWPWTVVGVLGGACVAQSAINLYGGAAHLIDLMRQTHEADLPLFTALLAWDLGVDVLGVVVWGIACGRRIGRGPGSRGTVLAVHSVSFALLVFVRWLSR